MSNNWTIYDGYGNEHGAGIADEVINRAGAEAAKHYDDVVVAEPSDKTILCRAYDPKDGQYWEVPLDWCDRLERGQAWEDMV